MKEICVSVWVGSTLYYSVPTARLKNLWLSSGSITISLARDTNGCIRLLYGHHQLFLTLLWYQHCNDSWLQALCWMCAAAVTSQKARPWLWRLNAGKFKIYTQSCTELKDELVVKWKNTTVSGSLFHQGDILKWQASSVPFKSLGGDPKCNTERGREGWRSGRIKRAKKERQHQRY